MEPNDHPIGGKQDEKRRKELPGHSITVQSQTIKLNPFVFTVK